MAEGAEASREARREMRRHHNEIGSRQEGVLDRSTELEGHSKGPGTSSGADDTEESGVDPIAPKSSRDSALREVRDERTEQTRRSSGILQALLERNRWGRR